MSDSLSHTKSAPDFRGTKRPPPPRSLPPRSLPVSPDGAQIQTVPVPRSRSTSVDSSATPAASAEGSLLQQLSSRAAGDANDSRLEALDAPSPPPPSAPGGSSPTPAPQENAEQRLPPRVPTTRSNRTSMATTPRSATPSSYEPYTPQPTESSRFNAAHEQAEQAAAAPIAAVPQPRQQREDVEAPVAAPRTEEPRGLGQRQTSSAGRAVVTAPRSSSGSKPGPPIRDLVIEEAMSPDRPPPPAQPGPPLNRGSANPTPTSPVLCTYATTTPDDTPIVSAAGSEVDGPAPITRPLPEPGQDLHQSSNSSPFGPAVVSRMGSVADFGGSGMSQRSASSYQAPPAAVPMNQPGATPGLHRHGTWAQPQLSGSQTRSASRSEERFHRAGSAPNLHAPAPAADPEIAALEQQRAAVRERLNQLKQMQDQEQLQQQRSSSEMNPNPGSQTLLTPRDPSPNQQQQQAPQPQPDRLPTPYGSYRAGGAPQQSLVLSGNPSMSQSFASPVESQPVAGSPFPDQVQQQFQQQQQMIQQQQQQLQMLQQQLVQQQEESMAQQEAMHRAASWSSTQKAASRSPRRIKTSPSLSRGATEPPRRASVSIARSPPRNDDSMEVVVEIDEAEGGSPRGSPRVASPRRGGSKGNLVTSLSPPSPTFEQDESRARYESVLDSMTKTPKSPTRMGSSSFMQESFSSRYAPRPTSSLLTSPKPATTPRLKPLAPYEDEELRAEAKLRQEQKDAAARRLETRRNLAQQQREQAKRHAAAASAKENQTPSPARYRFETDALMKSGASTQRRPPPSTSPKPQHRFQSSLSPPPKPMSPPRPTRNPSESAALMEESKLRGKVLEASRNIAAELEALQREQEAAGRRQFVAEVAAAEREAARTFAASHASDVDPRSRHLDAPSEADLKRAEIERIQEEGRRAKREALDRDAERSWHQSTSMAASQQLDTSSAALYRSSGKVKQPPWNSPAARTSPPPRKRSPVPKTSSKASTSPTPASKSTPVKADRSAKINTSAAAAEGKKAPLKGLIARAASQSSARNSASPRRTGVTSPGREKKPRPVAAVETDDVDAPDHIQKMADELRWVKKEALIAQDALRLKDDELAKERAWRQAAEHTTARTRKDVGDLVALAGAAATNRRDASPMSTPHGDLIMSPEPAPQFVSSSTAVGTTRRDNPSLGTIARYGVDSSTTSIYADPSPRPRARLEASSERFVDADETAPIGWNQPPPRTTVAVSMDRSTASQRRGSAASFPEPTNHARGGKTAACCQRLRPAAKRMLALMVRRDTQMKGRIVMRDCLECCHQALEDICGPGSSAPRLLADDMFRILDEKGQRGAFGNETSSLEAPVRYADLVSTIVETADRTSA